MKTRLNNPLWTHLPAAAVLIYFIVRLINAGALPASAPVHYNLNGVPDHRRTEARQPRDRGEAGRARARAS